MIEQIRLVEREFSDCQDFPTIMIANIDIPLDIEHNLRKMEEIIELAHRQRVNILIFPELSVTGYVWESPNPREVMDYLKTADNYRLENWIKNVRSGLSDSETGLEYIFYGNVRFKEGNCYNSLFMLNGSLDPLREENIYDKIFLPPVEQQYFTQGSDTRLVLDTRWGRLGFLICYDLNFVELPRLYGFEDNVDAIITIANWDSEAIRDYPGMNVRTDQYYSFLWKLMNSSKSAYNQIWSLGCNCVGEHEKSELHFCGESGVWAPSGMKLLTASSLKEELLLIRNIDLKGQPQQERDSFNYQIDFDRMYRRLKDKASMREKNNYR